MITLPRTSVRLIEHNLSFGSREQCHEVAQNTIAQKRSVRKREQFFEAPRNTIEQKRPCGASEEKVEEGVAGGTKGGKCLETMKGSGCERIGKQRSQLNRSAPCWQPWPQYRLTERTTDRRNEKLGSRQGKRRSCSRRRDTRLPVALLSALVLLYLSARPARCRNVPGGHAAVYIVRLRAAPAIPAYVGGIPGFPATASPAVVAEAAAVAAAGEIGSRARAVTSTSVDAKIDDGKRSEYKEKAGVSRTSDGDAGSITSGDAYISTSTNSNFEPADLSEAYRAEASSRGASAQGPVPRARETRMNVQAAHVKAFARMLVRQQEQVVAETGVSEADMLYSYKFSANGFAARLTHAHVRRLKRHPMVADVTRSYGVRSLTTYTPRFLQLPGSMWATSGGPSRAGDGVIVGVVDTGIWPEHPSFRIDNATGLYRRPPRRWAGKCVRTRDFPASRCSRKLIGARFFSRAYEAQGGVVDAHYDYRSPRDPDGHGTWCAGTAAGTGGTSVTTSELHPMRSLGLASGMAPKAHLAVYKVLWSNSTLVGYGELADVHYAVDRAIKDGVDVLSLSLGGLGPNQDYFDDLLYLLANQAGMVVVTAAGNQGPAPNMALWSRYGIYRTISNFSPFYLTVGASSIGRRFVTQLRLGNRRILHASGLGSGTYATRHLPLLSAADAAGPGSSLEGASHCLPRSLSPTGARNAIVLCARGMVPIRDKLLAVAAAGGAAMVLANEEGGPSDTNTLSAAANSPIPFVHITLAQAQIVRAYVRSAKKPIATILARCEIKENLSPPMVASFSSTGPTVNPRVAATPPYPTNDLLKPDVVAPGVEIWAAWSGHGNGAPSPMSVARPRRERGMGWNEGNGGDAAVESIGGSRGDSTSSSSSSSIISSSNSSSVVPHRDSGRNPQSTVQTQGKTAPTTTAAARRTRGTFALLSGTSMATPHVAGIAALIVQNYPHWTPAQVMSAIMTTARSSYSQPASSVAHPQPRRTETVAPGDPLPRVTPRPRPPQPPSSHVPVTGRPVWSLERSGQVRGSGWVTGSGTGRMAGLGEERRTRLVRGGGGDGRDVVATAGWFLQDGRRSVSGSAKRGAVIASSSSSDNNSGSTGGSSSNSSSSRSSSSSSSRISSSSSNNGSSRFPNSQTPANSRSSSSSGRSHTPANNSSSSSHKSAASVSTANSSSLIYLPIRTADGKIATPWDMGQGHIYPPFILYPGLTFNAGTYSYLNFLAGQNMARAKRVWPKWKFRPLEAFNLNRPSISVGRLKGSVLVTRTVTSVAKWPCTYEARVAIFPSNVKITVEPSKFTIKPGEMVRYTVNFTVLRPSVIGAFSYGSVVWVDQRGHVVRSILAVQPVALR